MFLTVKKKLLVFVCLWCWCATIGNSQTNFSTLALSLKKYTRENLTERLFVHTDKDYYQTGEIIWLKIYGVDELNRPLDFSKVVYAELLDKNNKPVRQVKIAMNKATGTGYIDLPQTVASGHFLLRAYTRWMRNSGPGTFFEKQLTVINMNNLPQLGNADSVAHKAPLAFFPEGGNIVAGIQNNIAYRLLSNTVQREFVGYVTDGKDTVATLLPDGNGLGKFMFTPVPGRSYTVSSGSEQQLVSLPPISTRGTVIQLLDEKDKYTLKGENNTEDVRYHLLVHSKGHLTFGKDIAVNQGRFNITFNKSELSDGVSVVTLFDAKLRPVCERVIFKRPAVKVELDLKTSQQTFGKRELVEVSMVAKDNGLLNDTAALSMSVFKLDSLQNIPQQNIYSYLWLTSELSGYIPDADQYFSDGNESPPKDMELLLLTHGWRRFDWDAFKRSDFKPSYMPELRGHILTGTVTDSADGKPLSAVTTYISAPSFITIFKPALSDSIGKIKAEFANFYGNRWVITQSKTKGAVINIDSPFSEVFSGSVLPSLQRPVNYPNTLLKQSVNAQVQSIYHNDSLYQFYLPYFADSSAFFGKADVNYQLDNYTRFKTVEEILREYVSLVNVRRKRDEVSLQVINAEQKQLFPNPPLNLLDGVPMFNFSKFFELDPLAIKSLDVVAQRYVLGTAVFDGILNWKSYEPATAKTHTETETSKVDYEGLLLYRKFYAPEYNKLTGPPNHLPDFRNLLYWQPDITLKNRDTSKINFYTSDVKGHYAVVVQGISSKGIPIVKISYFDVN